jgi:hypothetical protein
MSLTVGAFQEKGAEEEQPDIVMMDSKLHRDTSGPPTSSNNDEATRDFEPNKTDVAESKSKISEEEEEIAEDKKSTRLVEDNVGDKIDSYQADRQRDSRFDRDEADDDDDEPTSQLIDFSMPHTLRVRSERKRKREKKRRNELNQGLDALTSLLYNIEPELRFGVKASSADKISSNKMQMRGGTSEQTSSDVDRAENAITNRVDLINYAVDVMRRLHHENEARKRFIADLSASADLSKIAIPSVAANRGVPIPDVRADRASPSERGALGRSGDAANPRNLPHLGGELSLDALTNHEALSTKQPSSTNRLSSIFGLNTAAPSVSALSLQADPLIAAALARVNPKTGCNNREELVALWRNLEAGLPQQPLFPSMTGMNMQNTARSLYASAPRRDAALGAQDQVGLLRLLSNQLQGLADPASVSPDLAALLAFRDLSGTRTAAPDLTVSTSIRRPEPSDAFIQQALVDNAARQELLAARLLRWGGSSGATFDGSSPPASRPPGRQL